MNIKGKKILVTGGAGANGTNLVHRLKDENGVWVLDDLSSGRKENIQCNDNIIFIEGSIADDSMLRNIFAEGIEIVFHLAANFANQNSVEHPRRDLEVNGMGTLKLLEHARDYEVERFIYTSSSCVYGDKEGALSEDCKEFNVDTPYAITKLLGERYSTFFHEYYGLPTVILRYFNCYGPWEFPGRYRNVIPNFFQWARGGRALPITGSGDETRDFNFIEDTLEGTILAASHASAIGEIYNIGSGMETKIKDVARLINEICDNKAGIELIERREWDRIPRRLADITKANGELGYQPKTKLEEGLQKTYEWFHEYVW